MICDSVALCFASIGPKKYEEQGASETMVKDKQKMGYVHLQV
jgi:hypothetical protein